MFKYFIKLIVITICFNKFQAKIFDFATLSGLCTNYNVENVISQFNLQFCTIVEIGQGYCSMFVEFRTDPTDCKISSENVAEVYLGTCECATIRNWELCSPPLLQLRPYECTFSEGISRANSSARVHRRLCNPTMMLLENEPCQCRKRLGGHSFYPVTGFLTCYQPPLPKSICSHHSVCGVADCRGKTLFGIHTVQCDPSCKGKQPFCEEVGPITTKPPVITSYWSEWVSPNITCPPDLEISEALCVTKCGLPAFDCLGPGSYCCPPLVDDCQCIVTTTMTEMKVVRYISRNSVENSLKRFSIHLSNHSLLDRVWNKMIHMRTKPGKSWGDKEAEDLNSSDVTTTTNLKISALSYINALLKSTSELTDSQLTTEEDTN